MTRKESPLEVAMKGSVAGLIGTAVITVAMKGTPVIMQQLGISQPEPKTEAAKQKAAGEPTEKLAEKVSTGLFEQPIEEDTKEAAGQVIHWSYGAAWGALYGIMQSSLRIPHLLLGLLFGGVVGAVASTVVPSMGLTPAPTEQPASKNAMMMAFNLLYGLVTALAFHAMSRDA